MTGPTGFTRQLPTGACRICVFSASNAAFLLSTTVDGRVGMPSKTIHAAGGIVVRNGARPLIAVVQRAKDEHWVLPRGKLKTNESALAGARREVVEETGHQVRVREFLGAITYRARGRPKVVQFWLMRAAVNPSRDIMKDIMAVEWLPLRAAVRRLSYPLEKLFLRNVGKRALRQNKQRRRTRGQAAKSKQRRGAAKARGRKHRLRRTVSSRGRTAKSAGHPAGRSREATILQRVFGHLSK
jgi:8-oxo-dGTP diphosphatase